MTEPARTRHEKAVGHLKSATKALEKHRAAIEAAAQAHIDQHSTTTSPTNEAETTNDESNAT
jgi:hypothetical protein